MIRTPIVPASVALVLIALPATGPAQAQTTAFQLSSDAPIQIEADKLDVLDNEGRAIFSGNVQVVQGEISLRAAEMVVEYAREAEAEGAAGGLGNAGNIKRIDANGGVYVRSGEQVATGDTGTFDMATETVTLSGDEVVLTDAGNVIRGCKLTIAMTTGNAQVEPCPGGGRVQLLLPGGGGQ